MDWHQLLIEQLDWHWTTHLRPRLDGLTDQEYFWEPTPGAWNVHPRGESSAPIQGGGGDFVVDFAWPEPVPAPMTTIAWRLAHVIVGVLGERSSNHFGNRSVDYHTFHYAGTATQALEQLDEMYAAWMGGVRGLSDADLAKAVGPDEGPFAEHPMAELVLHISRETIHHGAEICLLRDLYLHSQGTALR